MMGIMIRFSHGVRLVHLPMLDIVKTYCLKYVPLEITADLQKYLYTATFATVLFMYN
jgi:hypothetical protein